jgi:hypothetical protein
MLAASLLTILCEFGVTLPQFVERLEREISKLA